MRNVRGIGFDAGIEAISYRRLMDEVHLPDLNPVTQAFKHDQPACMLDEVLIRPSLDQRLHVLLTPGDLTPDLMEPTVLSKARVDSMDFFYKAAAFARPDHTAPEIWKEKEVLEMAANFLANCVELDEEVQQALAALLKA